MDQGRARDWSRQLQPRERQGIKFHDCQFLFQVGRVYGKDGRKFAAAARRSGMECMAGRCAAPVK